ncbi:MAG TPA: hypothetical protein VI603_16310 [Saprospiraceae bacterium]|nr:hypothetical protein [Saprospiraceae bacterium]
MRGILLHIADLTRYLLGVLSVQAVVIINPAHTLAQDTKPNASAFQVGGAMTFRIGSYSASGIPDRYEPFTWYISGSPVLRAGRVQIPLRLQAGNIGHRRFGQPFNKFGMSPHGRWWKLHLGHSNINWSPYTLGGRTVLGGGFELNPGKFRIGFVYGVLQNAVEEFTDTAFQKPPIILHKRKGFAARLGIGSAHDYWDLILFKARDDTASVVSRDIPAYASPQENAVIGITGRQRIAKGLRLDIDAAVSAYSRNINSEAHALEENSWSRALEKVFTPRLSSRYNYAGDAALRFQRKRYGAELRYKRIDTDYQSMGAYFLQNDVENITGGLHFASAQNKFLLRGTFGWQRNNVSGIRSAKTSRRIGRLNAQVAATPHLLLHVNFNNYLTELQRRRDILEDTLALDQRTHHLSGGGRWSRQAHATGHSVFLEGFWRKLADKATSEKNTYSSRGFSATYFLQVLASGSGIETGLYYDSYSFLKADYVKVQPHLSFHQQLSGEQLSLIARATYALNYRESELQSTTFMPGLNVIWRASRQHTLNLYISYLDHDVKIAGLEPAFSEFRGDLSYTIRFQ